MAGAERGPLAGVAVVDLSTTFMGPYSTALLAQWGADVIKLEAPGGDILRYIGDAKEIGLGPVFLNANRGKRSIALDLKNEKAMPVFDRLVERADVVVHNLRPKAARKLGITSERLLGLNRQLVICAFRGFGAGGPYEDRAAYDDVIQGASGLAAVQGGGDGEPAYVKSALADKTMGLFGASAILAALHGRRETGRGRAIEVPMFESMASFTLLEQQGGLVYDPPLGPSGYARTASPQRRPCRTEDGYLAVMVYTDEQWAAFFEAIGRPDLGADPRYRTIRERTLHSDELYGLVNEELAKRTSAEWQELLDRAGIATGPVNTLESLFEDEHLRATGFFEATDHPRAGRVRQARPPVDMGDPAPVPLRHAPSLGEHSIEVLRELGYGEREVRELIGDGAAVADEAAREGDEAAHEGGRP